MKLSMFSYNGNRKRRLDFDVIIFNIAVFALISLLIQCSRNGSNSYAYNAPPGKIKLSFYAAADMREYAGDEKNYFRGACEFLASVGTGSFMISPGDIDPPDVVNYTVKKFIAADFLWYPVAGNHETETPSDMTWLRTYNSGGNTLPGIKNHGPAGSIETMYSFDAGDIHFVILNEYFDGGSDIATDGDITDSIYSWLVDDLNNTAKKNIIVVGHEPAYPLPDIENGRLRHENDSLNIHPANRDRFWNTLSSKNVLAYICGHTHNYSRSSINGVWQIDVGHSRGTGDSGARSTCLIFYFMEDGTALLDTFRINRWSTGYEFYERVKLK